jgi:ABC-type nitrate/sulfonate/bicarbonate transport system substrate-binding protein
MGTMRRATWLASTAGLVLTSKVAVRAQAPLEVVVGHTATTPSALNMIPYPVMDQMPTFFERAGVKVNVINAQMGEAVQMMMASNPPIVEGTGLGTVASGHEAGATAVKIFLAECQRSPYELVTRKGLTRMQDVKTLGVPGMTSAASQTCQQILKGAKLTAGKDYQLVLLGTSGARVAAVAAGKVDGSCELTPYPEVYRDKYGIEILRNSAALPQYAAGAWAYSTKWAAADPSHREVLVRVAMGVLSATRWAFNPANKPKLIDMLAQAMDVPRDAAAQLYHVEIEQQALSPDCYAPKVSCTGVFQAMVEIGAMKALPTDYGQYFDWSILQTAAQRLGVKVRKPEY